MLEKKKKVISYEFSSKKKIVYCMANSSLHLFIFFENDVIDGDSIDN
jgi:hypothetical protein